MSQRIEIDIRDGIAPDVALACVANVVSAGRISNDGKSYCFATTFSCDDEKIVVYTRDNRKNDCFIVKKED